MDLSKYEWLDSDFDNSMSSMVVPIILREELVGVINVTTTNEEIEYSNDDLSALQVFADNAGAFIRHSEQAEWMRKTIEKLRESKAKAADTISRP
jgi:GAF domain-containing protein